MKKRIEKLAATIKENGDTVPDQVCTDLWDLMNNCMDKDLQKKLWTIWRNSRCSNGDMPRLALEMLAASMEAEKMAAALAEAVKLMAEIHAAKVWHYAAKAREGAKIPAGWTIPDDSGLIGRLVTILEGQAPKLTPAEKRTRDLEAAAQVEIIEQQNQAGALVKI